MKIGMVLAGRDFPPDIRVEKEIRALQKAGHQCIILCKNQSGKPFRSEWEGSVIYRRSIPSLFLRKINTFFYWWFFLNIHWLRFLRRIAAEENIDVFHVHDLPMTGTALKVGKALNIPVIVDFHENFPAAVQFYNAFMKPFSHRLVDIISGNARWHTYERRVAKDADRVIVVVEEAKIRLTQKGIDPQKITVVENTIDVDFFESLGISDPIIEKYTDLFVISYIGGFGRHRGLDTAIQAMPNVIQEIPDARLLLVGRGRIKSELMALADRLGVSGQVIFEDWKPFEEVPSYIAASQICLVPHQSNPHTEATSPHKLFQYMLLEKPVLVSSCKPLQRVVQETGSGLVFTAGDSDSLAAAILQLKDDSLRDELGRAGKQAVLDHYNWERTSQNLIRIYDNL